MRSILRSLLSFLLLSAVHFSFSQSCVPTDLNGTVINLLCGVNCGQIKYKVPHLKSTSTYTLVQTAYAPLPYVTTGGTVDPSLYADDRYSFAADIPFGFCFYDSIFNKVVVGSNGLITFDTTNASCANAYTISPAIPSSGGGAQCSQLATYYPKAAIMVAYSDFDPSPSASPSDKKIEWRVEGTAPCRKFIVSFYKIGTYGSNTCGLANPNTFQIVIYESTGLIDFFIQNISCRSTTNSGQAILGIQDWTWTKAVFEPTRNATTWSTAAVNEGWRFVPSGGTSRFIKAELYDFSGTLLHTTTPADTATTTAGILDINFPTNLCPAGNQEQYIVKTYFSTCLGAPMVSSDTVTIRKTASLNATAASTPATCAPNGTISVNIPPGVGTAPFTASLNGGAPQTITGSSYTFTAVNGGTHSVYVSDASGCFQTINVTVANNTTLNVTTVVTPSACPGSASGTITLTPQNGTPPYQYQLNTGSWQSNNVITGVSSGTHNVTVKDASGCQRTIQVTVGAGAGISATFTSNPTSCTGANNGSITINPAGGTVPYTYNLNGGPYQTSNTFSNLAPGTYFFNVFDASGCQVLNQMAWVSAGGALTATVVGTATSCPGVNNGSISVTPTSGSGPYQYALNGGSYQASNIFNGLAPGNYTVMVKDGAGCTTSNISVAVSAGPAPTAMVAVTNVDCNGSSTGSATVVITNSGTWQYSLNGTNYQSSNVFSGLGAGSYTVYFRNGANCNGSQTFTITEPTVLNASPATQAVKCNGGNDGTITVTASGGTAPYQYSLNGTTYQTTNNFAVAAGTHTVYVKDNNGCVNTSIATVTEPSLLTATSQSSNASCDGGADGKIIVTSTGGTSPYEYSINNTIYQSANQFNVNPGPYTIYIKDANGCITTNSVIVGLTNNLTLTPLADEIICESDSVQLFAQSNATVYSWTPANTLTNGSIASPVAYPTVTTQYVVFATLGRCSATDTVMVYVHAAPIPDAGADGDICFGQTYTLQGNGGVSYSWSPSTYLNSATDQNPVVTPDKTTDYLLHVIDANGCKSLQPDTVTVNVTPPIVVRISKDTIVAEGDQFLLHTSSIATNYLWSPASGLSDPTSTDPMVTVDKDITYLVTATTPAGCKGTASVTLKVYKGPEMYVPSAFTPNNDGKNDRFFPFPVGIKSINYFRVYNRWGNLIFSTNKLFDGWDGKVNGVEQPTGVYVWTAEGMTKENKKITKRGTVTLIR